MNVYTTDKIRNVVLLGHGGAADGARREGLADLGKLLDASVKLMDGRSPLEIELPGPLNLVKKPLLKAIKGTLVEKVLRDHDVIKDYMLEK